MKTKTIGKIILGFATLNSLLTLSRVYWLFFTGEDFSRITNRNVDTAVTFTIVFLSILGYTIGIMLMNSD